MWTLKSGLLSSMLLPGATQMLSRSSSKSTVQSRPLSPCSTSSRPSPAPSSPKPSTGPRVSSPPSSPRSLPSGPTNSRPLRFPANASENPLPPRRPPLRRVAKTPKKKTRAQTPTAGASNAVGLSNALAVSLLLLPCPAPLATGIRLYLPPSEEEVFQTLLRLPLKVRSGGMQAIPTATTRATTTTTTSAAIPTLTVAWAWGWAWAWAWEWEWGWGWGWTWEWGWVGRVCTAVCWRMVSFLKPVTALPSPPTHPTTQAHQVHQAQAHQDHMRLL